MIHMHSNEDMYSKLSSGAVSYDVISFRLHDRQDDQGRNASGRSISHNIPNYSTSMTLQGPFTMIRHKYSVPYTYGIVGII